MSLYNMLHGYTPAVFFFLPMLGYHPEKYPRFRDCFTADKDHPEYDDHIHIYTRTGGGNREEYIDQNNWIRSLPGFVADYDDDYDNTFASWIFKIPEQFKDDYEKVTHGKFLETSQEYKDTLYRVYPKLKEKLQETFFKQNN